MRPENHDNKYQQDETSRYGFYYINDGGFTLDHRRSNDSMAGVSPHRHDARLRLSSSPRF
jgi:hypothetical protein